MAFSSVLIITSHQLCALRTSGPTAGNEETRFQPPLTIRKTAENCMMTLQKSFGKSPPSSVSEPRTILRSHREAHISQASIRRLNFYHSKHPDFTDAIV